MTYTREQIEDAIALQDCCPSTLEGMISQLLAENDALRGDAERLMYMAKDMDGFAHVKKDKWDFSLECAIENNREPTCEDELNGLRRLIDTARAKPCD